MTTEDIDTGYVCRGCIGDPFLRKECIRVSPCSCSYCGDAVDEALPLDNLAQRIHEVLQAHFELTSSQPDTFARDRWERPGEFVEHVIADIACINEKIAADVRELLSGCHRLSYHALKDGEDAPYISDACYEERGADDLAWKTFCDQIRLHARFFNTYAEDELTHIFDGLGTLKTFRRVIREIGPDDEGSHIWRARMAQSPKELEAILKSPTREIGPPPPRLAKGGRMNASGIPVFYGAMEKDTCIAELRALVGSQVVVAKFELLRPVRLLDLEALTEIWNIDASHFDPDYDKHEGRAASLRSLAHEICRPVMPQDEELEYLPSQFVAEYLANKRDPQLDGIIFHSSQTNGVGRNVVLFNHACGVEPDDLPEGSEVKVDISRANYDEDNDCRIEVFETVPPPRSASPRNDSATLLDLILSSPGSDEDANGDEEVPTCSEPTLRLDVKSVFVLEIKSVCYDHHRCEVFRHQSVKGEAY